MTGGAASNSSRFTAYDSSRLTVNDSRLLNDNERATGHAELRRDGGRQAPPRVRHARTPTLRAHARPHGVGGRTPLRRRLERARQRTRTLDRKSTRLNSSHANISYA